MEYGSSFHPEMTAARRVGSSEYFDRYFHLGIGPDDLRDATIAAALNEVLAALRAIPGPLSLRCSPPTPSSFSTSFADSLRPPPRRRRCCSRR